MSLFKKLFSKKEDTETAFSEGDIFYTQFDNKFHIYKLLRFDKGFNTFHVLSYAPVTTLPEKERIDDLVIQVYHAPIHKNGFPGAKLLTKSIITDKDLVGYHEYLQQTQNPYELADKASSYYQEAYHLTDAKKHQEAIDKYSMAIELVPDFFEAIDNRAFCKMEKGRWGDAIEDFRLSLSLNPGSLLAEFSIGECYLKLREYNKAKEQFQRALSIDPGHQPSKDFLKKATELANS